MIIAAPSRGTPRKSYLKNIFYHYSGNLEKIVHRLFSGNSNWLSGIFVTTQPLAFIFCLGKTLLQRVRIISDFWSRASKRQPSSICTTHIVAV